MDRGPAWNGVGKYLLFSDIPNNVQLRWIEDDGRTTLFRHPSGNSNGNTFDFQGRQIACEHGNRRVVRYEYNGTITVLASEWQGKPFNAPNDVIVHPEDGAIWFTDPGYGSMWHYEGNKGPLHHKEAVYRIDANDGKITKLTDEIYKPNGLCFSNDYSKLYVSDTGDGKNIKVWDISNQTKLKGGKEFASMKMDKFENPGNADGIRCDTDGNVWPAQGGSAMASTESISLLRRRPHRADPPPRNLFQCLLWRPQTQPPLHDRQPKCLRSLCRRHRRPHHLIGHPLEWSL